jgi:predicted RNA-binding protein with TRAM domain
MFVRHAIGRRGVVGFVYAVGEVEVGDRVEILLAKQQPAKD